MSMPQSSGGASFSSAAEGSQHTTSGGHYSHPLDAGDYITASQDTQASDGISTDGYENQILIPPTGKLILPCEFSALEICDVIFDYEETEAWIEHIVTEHLQDMPPSRAVCWFCDEHVFVAEASEERDRRLNFRNRMEHIREHFAEGKTILQIRPDIYMLGHLIEHNLISGATYMEAMRWLELPNHECMKHIERSNMIPVDGLRRNRRGETERDMKHRTVSHSQTGNDNPSKHPPRTIEKRIRRSTGDSRTNTNTPPSELDGPLNHSDDLNHGKLNKIEQIEDRASSHPKVADRDSHHSDSEESTLPFCDTSLSSEPISRPSTITQGSTANGMNALLSQEFATLLCQDESMKLHILVALLKEDIGLERMQNELRKMLKNFALNLKAEAQTDQQQGVVRFANSFSANITRNVFSKLPTGNQRTNLQIPEYLQNKVDSQEKMKESLQKLLGLAEPAECNEDSDQGSTDEETGEEDPYDGSLRNLNQMERFIQDSVAYQTLHRQIYDFVYPSLGSKLRCLVASWSRPSHKYHDYTSRYNLSNLVAELQYVDSNSIRFGDIEEAAYLAKIVGQFQNLVELWTKERWDWWPLPQCSRPLREAETRLQWQCTCGEKRWAELPSPFTKRLKSIIRSLPQSSTLVQNPEPPAASFTGNGSGSTNSGNNQRDDQPTQNNQGYHQPGSSSPFTKRLNLIMRSLPRSSKLVQSPEPPAASFTGNGSGSSTSGNNQSHDQPTQNNQSYHQPASSSSANANQPTPRSPAMDNSQDMHSRRVLFVVKKGDDYKMAQIGVSKLPCHVFFSTLRTRYFELRGFLRGWLSVWRYSHCDFYMCEKFDDHEIAPKHKNAFPEATDPDYEYRPKPMDNIPPVSEHEFQKRFYSCHRPQPLRHWYHRCKALGAHSYDILELFPKKKTELEEGGDKREKFWGIYAREIISLRWVLVYNLVCACPMLAFFVAWVLPAGRDTELQNPSVPFSMMLGMLSLFWSIFLSSLQFGRAR